MGDRRRPTDELEFGATQSMPGRTEDVPSLLRDLARTPDVFADGETPGPILGGKRYTMVRLVGQGGMAAVYLAIDEVLGKEVALKIVHERFATNLERLRDEVLLAHEVTHRNVCRTYDLEEIEGRWLVKMEYIDGQTLSEKVTASGPLSVAETCAIARQIVHGLAAAHERGVVHRDLKPQNILIERDSHRVVLTDFGLARLSELAGKTAEGVTGTPEFMAPEQARGREVDGRADLYALGCVLYYMLTGKVLFPAKSAMAAALRQVQDPPPDPRLARRDIPAWLAQLIRRLLEKDPANRPADAATVATALAGPLKRRRLVPVLASLVAASGGVAWLAWRLAHPGAEWSGTVRDLGADVWSEAPVFSPNRAAVAYASNRAGVSRIVVNEVDQPPRAIGPPDLSVMLPRWSSDGRSVLAQGVGPGCIAYRIATDGPATSEVVANDACQPEDCGGRLIFVRMDSPGCQGCPRIVVRDLDGRERDLVRSTADNLLYPHCDAAGRTVVYGVQGRGTPEAMADLWIAPLDGGPPRKLASDVQPSASFHPDGKSIVIAKTAEDRHFTKLWDLPLDGRPASRIAFSAQDLTAPSFLGLSRPEVSRNGRLLVFAEHRPAPGTLFTYSLNAGTRRELTSRVDLTTCQVTPDGKHIIGTSRRQEGTSIASVSTLDGEEETLTQGEMAAISPDGAEILYSVPGKPTRVYAMPVHRGTPRLITEVARSVVGLAVGPDGVLHLSVSGEGSLEAWQVPMAGGVPEREAPAPWFRVVPAPAGGWRAASRIEAGRPETHVLSPAMALGDVAARVVPYIATIAWAHDGASFLYQTSASATVHRLWVATGEDVILSDLRPMPSWSCLALSPDANTVYGSSEGGLVFLKLMTNFGDRPRP